MRNEMPTRNRGQKPGPGSPHFDEFASSGKPNCNYGKDSELGDFSVKGDVFDNLTDKGSADFGAPADVQDAIGAWGQPKTHKQSSIVSEQTEGGIMKPGSPGYGGPAPRYQKLQPHSDKD